MFYTVVGVERGEACVIERTQTQALIRHAGKAVLVQANHLVAEPFSANNRTIAEPEESETESSYSDSQRRATALEAALQYCQPAADLNAFETALNNEPVMNTGTYQKMVFCPGTSESKVWRRLVL